jgi:hypothetical protein
MKNGTPTPDVGSLRLHLGRTRYTIAGSFALGANLGRAWRPDLRLLHGAESRQMAAPFR